MGVSKDKRMLVFDKSNGRCSYCGCELKQRWQVDHVQPQHLNHRYNKDDPNYDPDKIDNLRAACQPCNNLKGGFSVEGFRECIQDQLDKCKNNCSHYRVALRFDMISEDRKKIEFYFETMNSEADGIKISAEQVWHDKDNWPWCVIGIVDKHNDGKFIAIYTEDEHNDNLTDMIKEDEFVKRFTPPTARDDDE